MTSPEFSDNVLKGFRCIEEVASIIERLPIVKRTYRRANYDNKNPIGLTLALVPLLSNVALAQKANPGNPSVPKGWSFSFPDGNADTGKQLFVKTECYACHTLKLPKESLAAKPGKVGPELTGYAVLPKEYLASSIIKAHTVVAAPGYTVEKGKAAMGNYNHFLTVQELIDLTAFLKHDATTPAK